MAEAGILRAKATRKVNRPDPHHGSRGATDWSHSWLGPGLAMHVRREAFELGSERTVQKASRAWFIRR